MNPFSHVIDCLIYSIKNKDYFRNNPVLLIHEFKKQNLIIAKKLAEDILEFHYDLVRQINIDDDDDSPLTEDHVLDSFSVLLKTFSPSPQNLHLGVFPDLKMRLFKWAIEILRQPNPDRKKIISSTLQLNDISTIVMKYDTRFEGKTIVNTYDNDDSFTVSALLPNNRIIIGTKDGPLLTIRNIITNEIEFTINVQKRPIDILVLNNKLFVSHNNNVSIWNLETFQRTSLPSISLRNIEILSNSKVLFRNDTFLEIWDLDKEIKEDSFDAGTFFSFIKIFGDNKVAIGVTDLYIYDLKTKKHEMSLKPTGVSQIKDIQLLSNNRLVIVHYHYVEVYDLKTEKIDLFYKNDTYFTATLFLENEQLLIAQENYIIKILNLQKEEIVALCYFPVEQLNYIKLLPGNEVLLASRFGLIGIWDLSTYNLRSNFDVHPNFWNLELTPDNKVVVSLPGGTFKVLI